MAKPFYLISHRTLTTTGVDAAIKHGANAIEIDLTAWKQGWWADHDAVKLPASWGNTAEEMFKHIASARNAGHTITFVWLDIKNPDEYSSAKYPEEHPKSTFEALRDLARQHLTPANIGILYGFYETHNSEAYRTIAKDLRDNEAIALDGDALEVKGDFDTLGPADHSKRVVSRGLFNLTLPFIHADLRFNSLAESVKSGYFNKVFGWTVLDGQQHVLNKFLDHAAVDGVIYGRPVNCYEELPETHEASVWIKNELAKRGDRYRLAENKDLPWGTG